MGEMFEGEQLLMRTDWKKIFKLLAAAAAGAGIFWYTRYSRRELQRLRQGSRIVHTPAGSVEVAERGSGDPVLVIQGSTGGYNLGLYLSWPNSGFGYIIPSRPGFLRTPLKTALTPEDQADLLAQLLDALGVQQAAVIALSGCGPQTFQLALRHPDRITALVLVSVASQPIPLTVLAARVVRALLRYAPFLPGMLLSMPPGNRLLSERRKAAVALNPERIDELRRLLTVVFPVMPRLPGMLNDLYWVVNNPAYPLEQIRTPTLVVHGDNDLLVPLEQAYYTVRHIPGAELFVVPGGGHLAFSVFQDEIKERVLQFLRYQARKPHESPRNNAGLGL
jgi:pimeloyl-ACP methyl ester carboxylesterase